MKQVWMILLSLIVLSVSGIAWLQRRVDPPVQSVVASSLQSLHEQNRLSAFAARFVTVVSSRKEQLGFAAEKTLIIPAMVRYEIDLAKLKQSDLRWDDGDVDMLKAMRVYKEIGYDGMMMPDHVPHIAGDTTSIAAFAYSFGYIKALIATVASES